MGYMREDSLQTFLSLLASKAPAPGGGAAAGLSGAMGAALAASRSQLDMAASLVWIGLVVGLLLLMEYAVLEPIKRELERWRNPD